MIVANKRAGIIRTAMKIGAYNEDSHNIGINLTLGYIFQRYVKRARNYFAGLWYREFSFYPCDLIY